MDTEEFEDQAGEQAEIQQVQPEQTSVEKPKSKRVAIIAIVAVLVCAAIAGIAAYNFVIVPANEYKAAEALLDEGKLDEAEAAFVALGTYKDSADKANEARYRAAAKLYEAGDYEAAKEAFGKIADYSDAVDQVKNCEHAIEIKKKLASFAKKNVKSVSANGVDLQSAKVTWGKVKGATGYVVQCSEDKKFSDPIEKSAKPEKRSTTFDKLEIDKSYYFRVKAVKTLEGFDVETEWSATEKCEIKLGTPKSISKNKTSDEYTEMSISWASVKNAQGYEVKFTGEGTDITKKVTETKITFKDLKEDTTYEVKVRAYATVNGKEVFGDWSETKSFFTRSWKSYYNTQVSSALSAVNCISSIHDYGAMTRALHAFEAAGDSYKGDHSASAYQHFKKARSIFNGLQSAPFLALALAEIKENLESAKA